MPISLITDEDLKPKQGSRTSAGTRGQLPQRSALSRLSPIQEAEAGIPVREAVRVANAVPVMPIVEAAKGPSNSFLITDDDLNPQAAPPPTQRTQSAQLVQGSTVAPQLEEPQQHYLGEGGLSGFMTEPFRQILPTLRSEFTGGIEDIREGINRPADTTLDSLKGYGSAAIGAIKAAMSPVTSVVRPLIAKPGGDIVEAAGGSPRARELTELGLEIGGSLALPGVGILKLPKLLRGKGVEKAAAAQAGKAPGSVPGGSPGGVPTTPPVSPAPYSKAGRSYLGAVSRLEQSGVRDLAGNINLRNLATTNDARDVIRVAARGIDRQVVSNADTASLARELQIKGFKPKDIIPGERTAELLASRDLLVKSAEDAAEVGRKFRAGEVGADEFESYLAKHRAFQQTVSGHVAEAGRTLQAVKLAAHARRTDVDSGTLDEIAKRLIDPDMSGAQKMAFLNKAPTTIEKVQEAYLMSILSGPKTQAANIIGNSLMQGLVMGVERPLSVAISKFGPKAQRQSFSSVGASVYGAVRAVPDAIRAAAKEFKLEADSAAKVEYRPKIGGTTGRVVRTPGRLLGATDVFFKALSHQSSLYRDAANLARSKGLKGDKFVEGNQFLLENPTRDMLARADRAAKTMTFQTELGDVGRLVQQLSNRPGGKFIMPFVRTPANIVKEALRRTPAAFVMPSFYQAIKRGGTDRTDAIAQLTAGSAIGGYFGQMAAEGMITGSAPRDIYQRNTFYAAGKKSYSVRLGDQWYSYARLEPFATILGTSADVTELANQGQIEGASEAATAAVQAISHNLTDKTFMQGLADLTEAFSDPDRFLESFAGSKAGGFIPSLLNQAGQAMDPVLREQKGFAEKLQSRIPGLREGLMPRREVVGGQEIQTEALGPDFLSPIAVSPATSNAAREEMGRLIPSGLGIGRSEVQSQRQVTHKGQKVPLTKEQVDQYNRIAGQEVQENLDKLLSRVKYRRSDDEEKIELIRKVLTQARATAKKEIVRGDGSTQARATAMR